jgi:hypothetical protein
MDSQSKLFSVAFLWLPSYGRLVLPIVALYYLLLHIG